MSTYPTQPPAAHFATPEYIDTGRKLSYVEKTNEIEQHNHDLEDGQPQQFKRELRGRHMQMIAIGMYIDQKYATLLQD